MFEICGIPILDDEESEKRVKLLLFEKLFMPNPFSWLVEDVRLRSILWSMKSYVCVFC